MTQLAVKTEMARLLSSITSPMQCDVFTQMPKEDEVGERAVVVVVVTGSREKRSTIGFGIGLKQVTHSVECRLWWVGDDSQRSGVTFDVLVSRVQATLRGYGAPGDAQSISDPETGEQSQILWLGEEINTRVATPEPAGDSSSEMSFAAAIATPVVENIQG